MYERFTDRARKVMILANKAAIDLNHEAVETEHLLLGLIAEGSGVAANVLRNLDLDFVIARREIEKLVPRGPEVIQVGRLPQTPRVTGVIEHAFNEARTFGNNYIGTEHLLLGLAREQEGVAAGVFMNLGLKLIEVREEVLFVLGYSGEVLRNTAPPATPDEKGKLSLIQAAVDNGSDAESVVEEIRRILAY
jgi:ATP-dependent Clp protease ATP-binding subunit ClpC